MKRVIQAVALIGLLTPIGRPVSGQEAEIVNVQLVADNKAFSGQITRPQLCPTDSNWIAFEVREKTSSRLYIYNVASKDLRELQPVSSQSEELQGPGIVINDDLSWRPTSGPGGGPWAAFVSNAEFNADLYLYNVASNKYFLLRGDKDTSGIAREADPRWSPDGKCLSYTSNLNGNDDIFVIRGMDWVLKNPENPEVSTRHEVLVVDDGNQSHGVWCPVAGSGYLAYTSTDTDGKNWTVRVRDPRVSDKSFDFVLPPSGLSYFAPSWRPDGLELTYYLIPSNVDIDKDEVAPIGDKYGLGVASVNAETGDSLSIYPRLGGLTLNQSIIIDVSPNYDRHRPAAWLPDRRRLLVSIYDEPKKNPLNTIDPQEWGLGSGRSDWLARVQGDGAWDFPRDAAVLGRKVTFSFNQGQARMLLVGDLADKPEYNEPITFLPVAKDRASWWKDYTNYSQPGFITKVTRWAWRPLVGPDFVLNKKIILLPGAAVAAYLIFKQEKAVIPPPRDWNPPLMHRLGAGPRLTFGLTF